MNWGCQIEVKAALGAGADGVREALGTSFETLIHTPALWALEKHLEGGRDSTPKLTGLLPASLGRVP